MGSHASSSGYSGYDVRELADPAKYDRLVELGSADAWWRLDGPVRGLHLLNDVRVPYFRDVVGGFEGKRILDVGCGGGIFAEALAREGARVVAIDASPRSLEVAAEHAAREGLEIEYVQAFAETFDPGAGEPFDAVMAVDVLEHVDDVGATIAMCARALADGGVLGFLTHNRTLRAFEELIWRDEYVLGLKPRGTHDFHKFLTPEDLGRQFEREGLRLVDTRGIDVDVDAPAVSLVASEEVSYLGFAVLA